MKAILRHLRVSPAKANLVAALVRGKKAVDAIDILKFTPKKSARPLKKLIESAVANAENNFKQDKQDLYIKEIVVTKGPIYKRSMPVSRGRANPILKRTAHITVKLAVNTEEEQSKKEEPKTSEPKVIKKKTVKKSK
jgi:large subunit ribosomal protein L22